MATDGKQHDELFLIDGNSLAYRAFFALPESIATSTGFPTNAIFGFASMLVKLLTEYGSKPTVVVWDAGLSGRKEVSTEYKATRTSRPSLLKEQWPHLEPLVDAFGYRNVKVDGYEADDVIASIAERARDENVPVMVVTGDRDAFQIIDPDSRVRVMATGRGITDTKVYDHAAVVERYGITPDLIPDFYGLKGDTSDNIPGVPGIGDKTASQLLQQFGSLESVLDHIDDISGAKRKQNLTEHSDDARVSKVLATIKRDVPVEVDPIAEAARPPDRSKLREVFREFELRTPLQRLEEAFGDDDTAAPAPVAEQTISARVREGTLADVAALGVDAEVAVAVRAPAPPEGELFAETETLAVRGRDRRPRAGRPVRRARGRRRRARRPRGHRPRRQGAAPRAAQPRPRHAARRLPPRARPPRLPVPRDLRGARARVRRRRPGRRRGGPDRGARRVAARAARRPRPDAAMTEIELPLVRVLRDMEIAGVRLNKERLAEVDARVREEIDSLEREIWTLAGEEFVIGSPSSSARSSSRSSACRRSAAARPASRPTPGSCRRSAPSTRSSRRSSAGASSTRSRRPTSTCSRSSPTPRAASTRRSCRRRRRRGGWRRRTRTCRTSRCARELGREIRDCFEAAPEHLLLSADYSQVELRVLAFIADEPVLKEIFVRGEDVHTATAAQVFAKDPSELTPMDRSKSKMINYGIVYGLSDYGLADRLTSRARRRRRSSTPTSSASRGSRRSWRTRSRTRPTRAT